MTLDRYWAVVTPSQFQQRRKFLFWLTLVLDGPACVVVGFQPSLNSVYDEMAGQCVPSSIAPICMKIQAILFTLIMTVIPCVVFAYCYGAIVLALKKKVVPLDDTATTEQPSIGSSYCNKQMIGALMAIVVIHLITATYGAVVSNSLFLELMEPNWITVDVATELVSLNGALHPLIVLFMMKGIRSRLWHIFRGQPSRATSRGESGYTLATI
jgi:hypothetical protein